MPECDGRVTKQHKSGRCQLLFLEKHSQGYLQQHRMTHILFNDELYHDIMHSNRCYGMERRWQVRKLLMTCFNDDLMS